MSARGGHHPAAALTSFRVCLMCPNYDHWMRRAAVRHAVHGSIVAVICACLSMGLCYAMPQHHRMDHKLLVVCLCGFAHHHVRSTFATLDEKRTRGFALGDLPRPVHRIMPCWRYDTTLARAGGASIPLNATTKDGTRKPSACGSATLLATVLAIASAVARYCSALYEHVIHSSCLAGNCVYETARSQEALHRSIISHGSRQDAPGSHSMLCAKCASGACND